MEIEGRYYGIDTLFIADEYEDLVDDMYKVYHVLIGTSLVDKLAAGECVDISWLDIERYLREGNIVTLEVKPEQLKNVPHFVKLKAHILLWLDVPELDELKKTDSIKVCPRLHDMYVFTLMNGQKVERHEYLIDRYTNG